MTREEIVLLVAAAGAAIAAVIYWRRSAPVPPGANALAQAKPLVLSSVFAPATNRQVGFDDVPGFYTAGVNSQGTHSK